MHRSFLAMNSVVCTNFHGYRPNFEAEKRIINVGPGKNPTKLHDVVRIIEQMLCNAIFITINFMNLG